jgi:hypothetical protein
MLTRLVQFTNCENVKITSQFPRKLRLEQIKSDVFNIRGWKDESLITGKIAPGMEAPFILRFLPQRDQDYCDDLICVSERERFIVPIRAISSRGIIARQ